MMMIGWPKGALDDSSWEKSRPMHGRICFSDEKTAITSPGNTTRARACKGRARDFCSKCFCLSKVICALAQMEVALAHFAGKPSASQK